ncbi:M56 family metallopeptidase [Paenibacillus hamazuiensis]|uniref:M56 family metallopeptidase n=1 Tax=Paenibacillus hamazuiensis TaxID=2936508 RepID=UPI002010A8E2
MNVVRFAELFAALFDWVTSVSIMAAILVALVRALQQVLKNRLKPRWHYFLWLIVILRLILPWGPESEFSIYNWIGYPHSVYSAVQINQEEVSTAADEQGSASPAGYRDVLAALWAVGVCLLALYTVWVNWAFALRMKKETVRITDARVLELFQQCKTIMKVHTPIGLVQSRRLAAPALFGFFNPVLIMPHNISESLNDEQLRHVFLHELAHCKRNDIRVNGLMYALLIVHWFNPVLWYAYRRMRDDQEIASDALALSYLAPDKRQDYGYTIIKLLENFSQPARAIGNVYLVGNKDQLKRRMRMIKQFRSGSYRWSFLGIAIIIFVSGCTLTNPKVDSSSAPLSSSAISNEKSAGAGQSQALGDTTQTAVSGDQQRNVSDDAAKQSASSGGQLTTPESKPETAGSRNAASEDKPRTAPSLREQTPAPATPSPVPAEETRAAAPEEKPRKMPSVREAAPAPASAPAASPVNTPAPASAPASAELPKMSPADGTRAEAPQNQPRTVPFVEVGASAGK